MMIHANGMGFSAKLKEIHHLSLLSPIHPQRIYAPTGSNGIVVNPLKDPRAAMIKTIQGLGTILKIAPSAYLIVLRNAVLYILLLRHVLL